MENSLLESQMNTTLARMKLEDALAKIIPHLPETASAAESIKAAIKATKTAGDNIHHALCQTEARSNGKIIQIRKSRHR